MRHGQIRRIDQLVLLQGNFFLQIQIECNPEVVDAGMSKTFKQIKVSMGQKKSNLIAFIFMD